MEPVVLALATFVSTYLGGLFTVRFKDKLYTIMAFTAGVLLGVVAFEILPEIISQIRQYDINTTWVMLALVGGFLLFHILEKSILIHTCHECDYADHKHPTVGKFSALALAGHSLMDGVSIGLGFQISPSVGLLVALAVISHDFTDGMNTVTMMLNHNNSKRNAKIFLLIDALAPIIGAASTLFFSVSPTFLTIYLGFFAGFLLYIGASDILPEAHRERSSYSLLALTILGVLTSLLLSQLA
jgi:ZIP family zinc transporter